MDLVYIVREGDLNEDLRYSLRSVEKNITQPNVWIVGYKPNWVKNVGYVHTEQKNGKWNNSVNNIIAACECEDISDDFVLMNDDFFAIKPVENLEKSCNVALGTLDQAITKYKNHKSLWYNAFNQAKELLKEMGVEEPYYNYESHSPIIINKQKFLSFINDPKVQNFINTGKVLHKRSVYKNIYKITPTILKDDVKIETDIDVKTKLNICEWLSVYDNQVHCLGFPTLNNLLKTLFPCQCKFEEYVTPIRPFGCAPKKKRDFIYHF